MAASEDWCEHSSVSFGAFADARWLHCTLLVCSTSQADKLPRDFKYASQPHISLHMSRSSESASTRSSKQAYLTSEILSEGYDPGEFTAYCESKKGSDIDLWSFEELIDCVQEFKATHSIRPPRRSGSPQRSPSPPRSLQRSATEVPKSSSSDLRAPHADTTYQLSTKRLNVSPLLTEPKVQSSVSG